VRYGGDMARRWSEAEWDELFGAYPPVAGHKPDHAACDDLGRRFERTRWGILWMWLDAEAYLRGARSFASQRLIDHLARRGLRPSS